MSRAVLLPMTDARDSNHTGQELELMLAGSKPLAYFLFVEDYDADLIAECESRFQTYVEAGRIIKCTCSEPLAFDPTLNHNLTGRVLLYALPEEAWRIPAMQLVLRVSQTVSRPNGPGPNEAIDRIVGALLGYTDEQVEAYIAKGSYPY
jgi:hypothetical protein